MFPQLDYLIQEIAAVAAGDLSRRAGVEAALRRMTQQGWGLEPAVQRIWGGERNAAALTQGLDAQETQMMQDVLDLLALAGPDDAQALPEPVLEALAGLPEAIRAPLQAALQAKDEPAFQAAYQAAWGQLSQEQNEQLRQALAAWAASGAQAAAGQEGAAGAAAEAAIQRQALLTSLPVEVRLALLVEDPAAFQQALNQFPPEQAAGLLEQIVQAGFFSQAEQRQMEQEVQDLEPVIQAIAAIAHGQSIPGSASGEFVEYLEAQELNVRSVIERIWGGERDAERLCTGLDGRECLVVQRILDLLG